MKKGIVIGCFIIIVFGLVTIFRCGADKIAAATISKIKQFIGNSQYAYGYDKDVCENFSKSPKMKYEQIFYLTDEHGKRISGQKYSMLTPIGNDLYIAVKNSKCGIINSKGKKIIPFGYEIIYVESDVFIAKQNGKKNRENNYSFYDKKIYN